ncbi:hypothetical protein Tco_1366013, partial [Tanacetum coccineum]
MLLNFRMRYNKDMPRRKWIATDQRRSGIMVNLIDKQLLERRIMQILETLVGARELEMDYRLMQQTVVILVKDRSKVRMGIMPTKTELALEQTQQGVSDEVLVSIEGLKNEKGMDDRNPTSANSKQALRQ